MGVHNFLSFNYLIIIDTSNEPSHLRTSHSSNQISERNFSFDKTQTSPYKVPSQVETIEINLF